jgi:hypothetical protein
MKRARLPGAGYCWMLAGIVAAAMCLPGSAAAQGFGFGFGNQEIKIVERFDKDGDGRLNREERDAARAWLKTQPRRGFFRRAGSRVDTTAGPKLTPGDVKIYNNEPLYDMKVLRTFFLEFDDADWEAEMQDFYHTDVDLPATLTVDGKVYRDVGVHFRGNSSFSTVPAGLKRSLNISMDFVHKNQRLYGYRTINLLNSHLDPTYMRTALYMYIARQYIAAPQTNWTRVVINGESWGVYVGSEQFNSDFTREWFHSSKGNRWHVPGSPRARGGLSYLGDDPATYKNIYEIKSKDNPQAWTDLIHFCKVLSTAPPEKLEQAIAPLLDIDGAIRFLALDKAAINDDGYWIRESDFNIYEDESGKFHVIPHDANETFREPEMGFGGGSSSGLKLDPFYGSDDQTKALYRLLSVPSLRAKYLSALHDIAENWLDWRKIGPMVRDYQAMIASDVKSDVHKLDTFADFTQYATGVVESQGFGFISNPSVSLRTFFDQRRAFLLNYSEPKKPAVAE